MSEERQTAFALSLAIVLVAGTFLAYLAFQDQYEAREPEADCSATHDYPACRRANEPIPPQEPGSAQRYLALAVTGIITILLIALSLKSAVMSQRDIVAPGSAPRPAAGATPAQAAPFVRTPAAIPNNAIPPELVAPPRAKPRQGPDLGSLEGRDG